MEFLNQPKPAPVTMPPALTAAGTGALDAYRAAIGGGANVKPHTLVAADSWHAGLAVMAAEEAAQLEAFHLAVAQRQPVVDDGGSYPQTRAFSADPDAQLMVLKSAAEAQRLADGEAALTEERAERKRRFDAWTPEANPPRGVMADEA